MRKLKRFETVCVEITNQGVKEKGIVLNECPWLELLLPEISYVGKDISNIVIKLKLRDNQIELLKKHQYITYRGEKYYFYLSTSSDMKKNQCLMVNEKYYEKFLELERMVSCNIFENENEEFCINKDITSRFSLFWSASFRTNIKPNYLVVPEATYKRIQSIKTIENDELVVKENFEHEVTFADGCGIAHPDTFKRVAEELELDYTPYFMCIRSIKLALKGLVVSVDFLTYFEDIYKGDNNFIKKIDGVFYIKDMWGNWVKVDSNTIIINPTMAKWSKLLNLEQFETTRPTEYADIMDSLFITKVSKKENSEVIKTNYQLLLQLGLNMEDYYSLTEATRIFLRSVLYKDKIATLKFLGAVATEENEDEFNLGEKLSYLLGLDFDRFIKLPWVQKSLAGMVERAVMELVSGKFYIEGNFKTIVQSPLTILNFAIRGEITDPLQENEFWCNTDDKQALIARNPIASFSEIQDIKLARNDLYSKYCGHWDDELLVFNAKDITASIMSGADFDGDFVLYTTNDTLRNAIIPPDNGLHFLSTNNTKGAKVLYTWENRVNFQLGFMGNLIGAVANTNGAISNKAQDCGYWINGRNITLIEYSNGEITADKTNEYYSLGQYPYTFHLTKEQFKRVIQEQFYRLQEDIYKTVDLSMVAIDSPKTGILPDMNQFEAIKSKYKFPRFFKCLPDKTYSNNTLEFNTNSVADTFLNFETYGQYGIVKTLEEKLQGLSYNNGSLFQQLFEVANIFTVDNQLVQEAYKEIKELFVNFKGERDSIYKKRKVNKTYVNYLTGEVEKLEHEYIRDSRGNIVYEYVIPSEVIREVKFKELMLKTEKIVLELNNKHDIATLCGAINLFIADSNTSYRERFLFDFFFNCIEEVCKFKYSSCTVLEPTEEPTETSKQLLYKHYTLVEKSVAKSTIGTKELQRFKAKKEKGISIELNFKIGCSKETEINLKEVDNVTIELEGINDLYITTNTGVRIGKVFDSCKYKKELYGLIGKTVVIDNLQSKMTAKSYNLIFKEVLI
ncbi:hypothetical protein Cp4435_01401 [Clostridium perfringens]|uniref:RNA dependent RNA polymerase n=1 Tax=Clostridium perfringens TaxID=1502 RepID=UPI00244433D6|nr:hypothetical protein [Clostridium perfringens]MDG6884235.1 hypothetical protein [Clostridium perfringens]